MKHLIAILFSFSVQAQVINCGLETGEQINACTLNDRLPILLQDNIPNLKWKDYKDYTAVDTCVSVVDDPLTLDIDETFTCPLWEPTKDAYTFLPYDKDAPLPLYDRLLMDNKPDISIFEGYLSAWKSQELIKVAFSDRVKALPSDLRLHAVKCNLNQPNLALLVKKIKEDKDEAKLACLESKKVEVDSEINLEKTRIDRIKKGRQAREFSNLILDLVAGFNIERQLTKPQVNQMAQTFKPILDLLQQNRPDSAKDLIINIVPDGTIVTQEIKDAILLEYTKAGL